VLLVAFAAFAHATRADAGTDANGRHGALARLLFEVGAKFDSTKLLAPSGAGLHGARGRAQQNSSRTARCWSAGRCSTSFPNLARKPTGAAWIVEA
jgi:hypothetical protein